LLLLEILDGEALSNVPCDVAVEEPGAGVVGVEGDDEPAEAREHGDIAAGGVVEIEGLDVG